jgi:hypothetical protein
MSTYRIFIVPGGGGGGVEDRGCIGRQKKSLLCLLEGINGKSRVKNVHLCNLKKADFIF